MDLQELITRGRFLFGGAPERLRVFDLVDGKRNASDIAKRLKRHVNNVHRDLRAMLNADLIREARGSNGAIKQRDGIPLYEKVPLARTVPTRYFRETLVVSKTSRDSHKESQRGKKPRPMAIPSETEILDVCRNGEDQLWEFKSAGTESRKITREICAMLNTRAGGIILYGVDDNGTLQGTDVTRQKFDQMIQNSVKNGISPAATVKIASAKVMGTEILLVIVAPWDRHNVFQFEERVLVRKGTNVFAAKAEELRKLHQGNPVI